MKTYFKYEGLIKSKEAAEAIAAPVALGLLLENGEHELLLAHALGVVDFERVGDVEQLRDVKGLEVGKMHSGF